MKERVDPDSLESLRARGVPRMPDGVACFIDGTLGAHSIGGPFPYPRFWFWLELACPRLVRDGKPAPQFIEEVQVYWLYRSLVPWLAYGMGDPAAIQRATDLVCLIDELMAKEDELYRYYVAWPMSDLAAVFRDVAATAHGDLTWDMLQAWGDEPLMKLVVVLVEFGTVFAEHVDCCTDVHINVHWW